MQAADFKLDRDGKKISVTGDWTSITMGRAADRLERALRRGDVQAMDVSGLGRLDTAGAFALMRATGLDATNVDGGREDVSRLMQLVHAAAKEERKGPTAHPGAVYSLLVRAGEGVMKVWEDLFHTIAFQGRLISTLGRLILNPTRFRWAPTVSLMERAGLDALPIVAVTNFFVGATLAFLGATLLSQFGAQTFSVELVGIGVLREFGVLVTAIILAGRSASSFAAELGIRVNFFTRLPISIRFL